ncbi:MAG: YbaK/EbsC family protein [Gammaproteobacteria bacterium]|nr:YbaK/EbsC family protein [Gammaproteobacteria bacterium]NNF62108.1 YbaK/EbsC family protein [Gammaproteobacteria bacterium]NNM20492.1 YbaK/EbsC family protein [Gammaproteobacteria bacterium]
MAATADTGTARFAAALAQRGIATPTQRLPASTRTAGEAAAAVGCSIAEIAKSIVFRLADSDLPVLVIASGSNRVDVARLAALAGEGIEKADADFVRRQTGYAIGGIPPFAHARPIRTFVDEDLFGFDRIWAAAGGAFDVFATTAAELLQHSGGSRAEIREQ